MNFQRLDKIIASQFNTSRSEARACIRKGLAEVNGMAVRDPAIRVLPDIDRIVYRGQAVSYKKFVYLCLNKPKGVLSASNDKNRQTVVDLVPEDLKRQDLAPVGRLDKDTTGLLLITDDGQFSHRVISPKSNIKKLYRVVLDAALPDNAETVFSEGVILADKTKCLPARLERISSNEALVEICEGKYHQIKRMFGTLGLGVTELKRLSIGRFSMPQDLNEGECRELYETEIESIFQ